MPGRSCEKVVANCTAQRRLTSLFLWSGARGQRPVGGRLFGLFAFLLKLVFFDRDDVRPRETFSRQDNASDFVGNSDGVSPDHDFAVYRQPVTDVNARLSIV